VKTNEPPKANLPKTMKPQTTFNTAACLALGLALLLAPGCRTTAPDTSPVTTAELSTPKSSTTPPPGSGKPIPDTMAAEASAEAVRHFNFLVKAAGNGPTEAVRQAVEGRLAAAGYKMSADTPDILVQLDVRASEFDRAGDYLRYEGTIGAGVNRVWDDKRLGFETVSIRGKRGLGADEALGNLASELSTNTANLVMKFARPEQSGLAALDVTVRRPWLTAPDPDYAPRFIKTAKAQRGVVYCALVAHGDETRLLTFRAVYLAEAMPEGLPNRLASLKELGLKPRN
jgi:hypothetical protein